LAVAWVLMFHLNGIVGPKVISARLFGFEVEFHPLITVGWVGANLFFVLSGFLLTNRLLERFASGARGPALKSYLIARIRRVFPAYWAQILVLLAVSLVVSRQWPDWVRFLPLHSVMIHNLDLEASWAINPVYWTLPIEFSFYLCLPLIAVILARAENAGEARRWMTLALVVGAILVLSWTYRYLVYRAHAADDVRTRVWLIGQIPGSIDQFILGGAAGVAMRWSRPRWSALSPRIRTLLANVLLVAGLGGIIGMMYFLDAIYKTFWSGHWAVYVWYTITSGFAALALCSIVMGSPVAAMLFANRLAVFIGTISYSIYLWHYPIGEWTARAVDVSDGSLVRLLAVSVPLILLASAISYYLVERRFMAASTREREEGKTGASDSAGALSEAPKPLS
jgi:peptidoglycan/LPS O-acetylase OafA/YrhL